MRLAGWRVGTRDRDGTKGGFGAARSAPITPAPTAANPWTNLNVSTKTPWPFAELSTALPTGGWKAPPHAMENVGNRIRGAGVYPFPVSDG